MTVTFSDVEQAILRRVDEHISNGGAQQRVDVYDPGGNGMRVAWGGTLEELRSELISRISNPSWYWLCEIIDVQDLHPTDLDEIPHLHVRPTVFETIVSAALLVNGEVWSLPRPARHHVLIEAWCSSHWRDGSKARIPNDHIQGFVTSRGRFVDREAARELAIKSGQIEVSLVHKKLTTEDLW